MGSPGWPDPKRGEGGREGGGREGGGRRGEGEEEGGGGRGEELSCAPLPAKPFHWTPPSAPEALSHRVWGPSSCPSKGPPTAARGGTKGGKKGVREERRGEKDRKLGGCKGGLPPCWGGKGGKAPLKSPSGLFSQTPGKRDLPRTMRSKLAWRVPMTSFDIPQVPWVTTPGRHPWQPGAEPPLVPMLLPAGEETRGHPPGGSPSMLGRAQPPFFSPIWPPAGGVMVS